MVTYHPIMKVSHIKKKGVLNMLYQAFLLVRNFLSRFGASKEKGQGLVEYALILVFVSIVVIVVLGLLGTEVNTVFQSIVDSLQDATP